MKSLATKTKKIKKTNFKKVSINNFHETKRWMVTKSGFVKQTKSHQKQDLTQRLRSISLPWWIRVAKIPYKKSCMLKQKMMTLATIKTRPTLLVIRERIWSKILAVKLTTNTEKWLFNTKSNHHMNLQRLKILKIARYAWLYLCTDCVYTLLCLRKLAYMRVHLRKHAYIHLCN